MIDLIHNACRNAADASALRSVDLEWTFRELDQQINKQCEELAAAGVEPGDRVGFQLTPSLEYCVGFWATIRMGATFCPFNPRWPASAVDDAAKSIQITHLYPSDESPIKRMAAARPKPDFVPATILFTSGSTGRPKALAHGLSAHEASAVGANRNMPITQGDAWLLSLPIFHVAGIGILFRCAVGTACVAVPASGQTLAAAVDQLKPTHLSLVPTQLRQLIDETPSPPEFLRAILLGGGPASEALVRGAIADGWPLATTYGLTEMASQVTATRPGQWEGCLTAGRCLEGRQLRISEHGEILVRGATLYHGIVQPNGHMIPGCNQQGWYATGDLGSLDKQGRLHILGRMDNMFISGGENIHPEEIERCLIEIPGIAQAVVVPVASKRYGKRPIAFIEYASRKPLISEPELRSALEQKLPKYKIPDQFLSWHAQTGVKPDRKQLERLATERVERDLNSPDA